MFIEINVQEALEISVGMSQVFRNAPPPPPADGFHNKISSAVKTVDVIKKLSAVPASLLDEYGCLSKGNKFNLANRLGVFQGLVPHPQIIIFMF